MDASSGARRGHGSAQGLSPVGSFEHDPAGAARANAPLSAASKVARLEQIIDYRFKSKKLAQHAITHPSAAAGDLAHVRSYERLEFLGDALVGAFMAAYLYEHFPDLPEGRLTRMKTALVSGSTMTRIGRRLGLDQVIIFGSSETGSDYRGMDSALENVFESLSAALALDGGTACARDWVVGQLAPLIGHIQELNPASVKTRLQELTQLRKQTPTYRIIGSSGPAHARSFEAEVLLAGQVVGQGQGRSKKEAETEAASAALHALQGQAESD
ncbi:MAG: ribonuclease III [Coriobacteriales bacterium]|jgi:ribonuclease-3|nr:ribonuclease III [Coriobacteriales bacterium]